MEYPFIDEYLNYDYTTHRYVLTAQDLLENFNENLNVKFKDNRDIAPFLKNISNEIYAYIHLWNVNNAAQDFVIAKTEGGRKIIREAMEAQAIYELRVGNYKYSGDPEKQKNWLSLEAKDVLERLIPEIRVPIIYGGVFPILCADGEW